MAFLKCGDPQLMLHHYETSVHGPASRSFTPEDLLAPDGAPAAPLTVVLRDPETGAALGWAVPNVLRPEECDECIRLAREHCEAPARYTLRTARRSKGYVNQELADRVAGYLPQVLLDAMDAEEDMTLGATSVSGVHPNWRLVSYAPREAFPAHLDQTDSLQVLRPDGTKELHASTHTLLVMLSDPSELRGGATRFFPGAGYDGSVDVSLPRGWALVFRQRGLLHCGLPVLEGRKFVAQAGLLRPLPAGAKFRPTIFKWGPGLVLLRAAAPAPEEERGAEDEGRRVSRERAR